MGQRATGCCRNKPRQDRDASEERRGCLSRLKGESWTPTDEFGEMRFKSLSFYDFDEDKSKLVEYGQGAVEDSHLNFDDDDSDVDTLSDFQSVDEGSIAILSMDEIRNMKNLEM